MATKRSTPFTKILLLIAGLCLFIKYILEGNLPSSINGPLEVFTFICKLAILILIIALYAIFLFGVPGYQGSFKALAPSILFFAISGQYALNYADPEVTGFLGALGNVIWLVMLVSGFVFLFLRKKIVGMTFSISAIVYTAFIVTSYTVTTIVDALNATNYAFSWNNFFIMALLVTALVLCFFATYVGLRRREWTE